MNGFNKTLSILLVLGALQAQEAFAEASLEMDFAPTADGAPQVIGGVPANGSDWPATLVFKTAAGRCTSTLVGPKAILTAAHCVENNSKGTVKIKSSSVTVKCEHHPRYAKEYQYDLALCAASAEIQLPAGKLYETLNTKPTLPRIGDSVTLLGYGCRQEGGGGSSGSLYVGSATLSDFSGIYLVTSGGAAVCFGDSGGAAYARPSNVSQRIIGVNSRGNIEDTSYLTPIASAGVLDFLLDWSDRNKVGICGLHEAIDGCQP